MKKHKNFIARLLHRNNNACEPLSEGEEVTIIINPSEATIEALEAAKEEAPPTEAAFPTLCKGGKLFRARLRNGRWETMGPPIGDC